MKNIKKDDPIITGIIAVIFALLMTLVLGLLNSCTSDDLAFDVIESPVSATFKENINADEGMLSRTATFYELDKTGILDQNIGIDSTLISGLSIEVFVNENTSIGQLTTDSDGQAILEKSILDLDGATRLEWVGNYNSTPFRIYRNF